MWLELIARPKVVQERREQEGIYCFLVNEMCEFVQYTCDVCEQNKRLAWWKGGINCKRGRLRRISKIWFKRRKAWRMSLMMIKEAAQYVVRENDQTRPIWVKGAWL